jgi:NADH-dependent peroxiredoxin subunit F
MYDIIIVGAGPAGITAAVYAARKRMKTLVLSKDVGGQAARSWDIENYTGYQFITGPELAAKFEEHLKNPGIETVIGANAEVTGMDKEGESFAVTTKNGRYNSRTVIVATGRKPRILGIPGESEYKNKGVTYCATCDGPLFADKDIAIVGGGNSALDTAVQMLPIAGRIYMVDIDDHIIGDPIMLEKLKSSPKVEFIMRAEAREIVGDRFVTGLKVLIGKREERTLPVGGVFIEIGSLPSREPKCGVKSNDKGEITVNERCETSIQGIFAAGDVTDVPEKQIIVAAGQGCIASLSAFKYLSKRKFKEDE